MRCLPLSLLSALAARLLGGLATPIAPHWDRMRVKHAWDAVPENWENLGHPPHATTIDLHLALKSHNENALIDALYEVSDPKSLKYVSPLPIRTRVYPPVPLSRHRYGAHLSKEQVAELVAPHPDTLELVNSWLEHHGVSSSSVSTTLGGNWLTVVGVSVPQANDILGTSYQLYQHAETSDTVLRTISYSLPEALHGHVETVVPTTYFGSSLSSGKSPRMRPGTAAVARVNAGSGELVTALASLDEYATPPNLRRLYHMEGYVPAATDRNGLGIAGYLGQFPSQQDLKAFMTKFRTEGSDAMFYIVQINGGAYDLDPSKAGREANLDIHYTEAITYPTPHIYYSTGIGTTPGVVIDPYLSWFKYVLEQANIPQTIMTSYGNLEHNVPPDYAVSLCRLFLQLGARGVSALFASGDRGVGEGNCLIPDSSGRVRFQFVPEFPASCTCGVIFFVCKLYTSVSTSRSQYHHAFVGPYVTTIGSTMGEEPEVATVFSGGGFSNYFPRPDYQATVVPTFLEKLGNQHNGLYKFVHGGDLAGLNDITSGSNQGCGIDGFTAIVGWDPVSPARLVSLHFRCWLTLGL